MFRVQVFIQESITKYAPRKEDTNYREFLEEIRMELSDESIKVARNHPCFQSGMADNVTSMRKMNLRDWCPVLDICLAMMAKIYHTMPPSEWHRQW